MLISTLALLVFVVLDATYAQKIVTITVEAPEPTTAPSYILDNVFKKIMLDVSNKYRYEHNATNLKWNDTLAQSAYDWAKQCRWKHSVRIIPFLPLPNRLSLAW